MAMPATMAGSLLRCSEAGSSTPLDMWMTQVVSSTVTNCLPAASWKIVLGAAEARQNERLLAGDQVAAVEFGGDLDGEAAALEGFGGVIGVGRGDEEIATEADEDFDFAFVHGFDGHDGIEAMFVGRGEVEFFAEGFEEFGGHFFPDADGAVALDVGVSADWAEAGAFTADVAAEEGEVGEGLDIGDAVFVLGDAHGPGADHAFRFDGDLEIFVDFRLRRDATAFDD